MDVGGTVFQLAERPALMPGMTLTGSTTGPVVDTEKILVNGGRVYLSRIEVAEAVRLMPEVAEERAAALGWVSPEEADGERVLAAARIAELEAELAVAQTLDGSHVDAVADRMAARIALSINAALDAANPQPEP